ncbi:quinolinate synthase NadA [Mollicutes bacterium LVI A0078]|nr:quinolinate synthase NadA [Mollicutes bacterium LVI A0075]WOO91756.1 quinolinate synthase NadA [Mollicutes bacterium LVI A0078]
MNKNIIDEIKRLKTEKNAVILAHYYQTPEIQDIADYTGDSLALSIAARDTDADIIVFCGVHFMAETAKIISPHKMVLLPELTAGCPMADMIDGDDVRSYKAANPGAKVMCYVNSTADVKAESDVCVTSTNAMKIAENYKGQKMLYVPDQNLGEYLNEQVEGLELDLWPGHCCIHNNLKVDETVAMQEKYPNAKLIVHPECNPKVVKMAEYVGSTKGLLNYVIESDHDEFIIGTEEGILHQVNNLTEGKTFHLLSERLVCRNMKKTNLEKLHYVLDTLENQIEIEQDTLTRAQKAINLMLELS